MVPLLLCSYRAHALNLCRWALTDYERFMILSYLCRQCAKRDDNDRVIRFPRRALCAQNTWELVQENVKDLSKKIYVGNLSFDTTEEQVNEMFAQYGKVDSIVMITDRDSGRFRGFCFVEMEDSAANTAIQALNDTDLDGRTLRVNEARPRQDRGGGRRRNKYPDSGGRRPNKYPDSGGRRRNKFPDSGGGNSW
jgi:cold-inducible RNA-binding protein